MELTTQLPVEFVGWAFNVPERVRSNQDIMRMFPDYFKGGVAAIRRLTGIAERRIADSKTTSTDLGVAAAKEALRVAGIKPSDIGVLKVARTIPDDEAFATACLIQERLGIGDVAVSDTVAACAGSIYAMEDVVCQMAARQIPYGMVIGTEIITRLMESAGPDTTVLFGDAGGAWVFRLTENPKLWVTSLGASGKHSWALSKPLGHGKLIFHGDTIYREAVRILPKKIKEVCDRAGITLDDVGRFFFHQANARIIQSCCWRLGLCGKNEDPPPKVVVNIHRYGNTSTASMIIAFCEEMERSSLQRGELIIFAAVGAGMSTGVTLLEF